MVTKNNSGVPGPRQIINDLGIHINFYKWLLSCIVPQRMLHSLQESKEDMEIKWINRYLTHKDTKEELCIKQIEEPKANSGKNELLSACHHHLKNWTFWTHLSPFWQLHHLQVGVLHASYIKAWHFSADGMERGLHLFSSHNISTSSLCTCINRVNFSVTSFGSCKLCRYCTGIDQNIQRPKKPPHLAWNVYTGTGMRTCLLWYDDKPKWHSSNIELLQVSCYNMWKYLTLSICPSVFYRWRTIHIFSICSWGFSHQTEWYTKFIVGGIKHVCKLSRLDIDGLLMVTARTGTSV